MKNILKKLIIVVLFIVVGCFIISKAPQYELNFKYKDGDLRVIINDIEITRDTARLPEVAALMKNEPMLSHNTIDILFDKDLYFEEKYTELSDDNYPYTDWINNNLNVTLSRFYNRAFDYELLNLIKKENIFDKILKQMEKTHKLIILPLYSRWDICSILSFSYYSSLINYLQEKILLNQKD